MKTIAYALVAAFLLCTSATAAINTDSKIARNMDDVYSLGVIYINHNFATVQEAELSVDEDADRHGAKQHYHIILMKKPGSNDNLRANADIYR